MYSQLNIGIFVYNNYITEIYNLSFKYNLGGVGVFEIFKFIPLHFRYSSKVMINTEGSCSAKLNK